MKKIFIIILIGLIAASCSTGSLKKQVSEQVSKEDLTTNASGSGREITVDFASGPSFYYPLIAVWIEQLDSSYVQTLYVSKSVATGIFRYGKQEKNAWVSAPKRAPQTLPYWSHKRGIVADDGLYVPDQKTRVPDAYSGASATLGFVLHTRSDSALPQKFRILLEVNQNWDWNEYWTNDKYPDDENYKYSCQPALVYEAIIDMNSGNDSYEMHPIGHSHYSGKDGKLYTDLSTITTALQIAGSIKISVK